MGIAVRRMSGRTMGAVVAVAILSGCNPVAIKKCHDEMSTSQQAMMDMDSDNIEQVEKALAAVNAAVSACEAAERADETSKVKDAQKKLSHQLEGLKEKANRPKLKPLSPAELEKLEKNGDPMCPRGQEYEHHQNKKMIRCTGAQLVEMNWQGASKYFKNRGLTAIPKGALLRFEKGARVYDFQFDKADSKRPPVCLSIVPDPGVSWQEVVARATGAHPQRLKLGKPVPSKVGPLAMLVEGTMEHVSVKLGKCEPTPGQKPFVEPPKD